MQTLLPNERCTNLLGERFRPLNIAQVGDSICLQSDLHRDSNHAAIPTSMDALQLPEDLNAAYFLQLLVHHDWDDLSPALKEQARKTLAPDEHGTINLNVKTKSFTILLKGGKLANASTWTYEAPHSEWFGIFISDADDRHVRSRFP